MLNKVCLCVTIAAIATVKGFSSHAANSTSEGTVACLYCCLLHPVISPLNWPPLQWGDLGAGSFKGSQPVCCRLFCFHNNVHVPYVCLTLKYRCTRVVPFTCLVPKLAIFCLCGLKWRKSTKQTNLVASCVLLPNFSLSTTQPSISGVSCC